MKEVIWPPPTFNLMHLLKISRISHEKEKYMRLAECEAETICNLGKGSKINEKLCSMDFFKPFFRKGEL